MPLLALFIVLSVASAEPQTQIPTRPTVAQAFEDRLEGAKKLYFQGHRTEALDLLQELRVDFLTLGGEIPWPAAAEMLIYLGEIHYFQEDLERAEKVWRMVLEQDPDHPRLSPFAHPPEVAGEFEILRARVREEVAARPIPPPPALPAWSVLPMGLPQFIGGQPARGVAYGTLQVGLGAGSIAMYSHLRAKNVRQEIHPDGWTVEEQRQRVTLQRFALQWPLTIAAYGVWLGSHLDARATWKRTHALDANLVVHPTPGGGALVGLSGSF